MSPAQVACLRQFLSEIRIVSEDFATVFYNRIFAIAPNHRLALIAEASDNGELMLSYLAELVGRAHEPERLAAMLVPERQRRPRRTLPLPPRAIVTEAFLWTAGRCLGERLTPALRQAWLALDAVVEQFDGRAPNRAP